ncbi:hypothetical protein EV424DRAFT_1343219 [Suillus variegatus]|nr:hypothetical protein EV424DRAFT_1343219 [Suillus variegatus]
MSSSAEANTALNLVTQTIQCFITRFNKLQVGDPAAKTLTHDIAITLHSLNRDKSGPDRKLKSLPDWSTISDDDHRIKSHPLFLKTVNYRPLNPSLMPPTRPTSLLIEQTREDSAPTLPSPAIDPAVKKYDLVVLGNKHKAPEPEIDTPSPTETTHPMGKTLREASRVCHRRRVDPIKELNPKGLSVTEVPEDKVIYVSKNRNMNNLLNLQVDHWPLQWCMES